MMAVEEHGWKREEIDEAGAPWGNKWRYPCHLSKVGGHKSWSLTLCCRKLTVGFSWLRDERTLRQALFGGGGAVTLSL